MPFSVYLHFPFCRNRCSYCDFYKELHSPEWERAFYAALITETELASHQWPETDRHVATIFIGGGTPSLTSIELLSKWLDVLKEHFTVGSDIEFSIENNPESVTKDNLAAFRDLGINRPTYGIQSFRPDLLKLLNRKHRPADSHRAVYLTNALGYTNFGVDLIFGLPRQTTKMLSSDLDQLLELYPPHISFYQLTIEPGTPLAHKVAAGNLKPADEDLALAMYRGGCENLVTAGYERYEVSSFAREGFACEHNIRYWEGDEYLGLGPSAHSFLGGRRFANVADTNEYIRVLGRGHRPMVLDQSGIEERKVEAVMLGLRTARGIDRERFAARFDCPVESLFDRAQYDLFVGSGHIIPDRGKIRLSDDGFFVADAITRRLLK